MATYHAGERAVQARAGVRDMAERIGRGIHEVIPPAARAFLRAQRIVFLGTVDAAGAVWASVLSGVPGFLRAADERTLRISAAPPLGDPLRDGLHEGAAVGVLAIDLAGRRRMRVNGTAETAGDAILVHTRQVYANCPKYIQRRTFDAAAAPSTVTRLVTDGGGLTAAQRAWIARADTFVVASAHVEGGADASHRGGNPGFVRVVSTTTLCWPDYPGNAMFQTLGNLAVNPAAGLVFLDFERGATLQLTGKARIVWDGETLGGVVVAGRAGELTVERAIEIEGNFARGWGSMEPSPHNPPTAASEETKL